MLRGARGVTAVTCDFDFVSRVFTVVGAILLGCHAFATGVGTLLRVGHWESPEHLSRLARVTLQRLDLLCPFFPSG